MTGKPQCTNCIRLISGKIAICEAFPAGIPPEILDNSHDHVKSFKGDGGLLKKIKKG